MTNESESETPFTDWVRDKKKQKQTPNPKEKKKSISPEREQSIQEAYNRDMDEDQELEEIKQYLGTGSDSPNAGTRARQVLMNNGVKLCRKWKTGTYKEWLYWLSLKLNLSVKNVRDNYIAVLLETGIIKVNKNGLLEYVGMPKRESKYQ